MWHSCEREKEREREWGGGAGGGGGGGGGGGHVYVIIEIIFDRLLVYFCCELSIYMHVDMHMFIVQICAQV